MDFKDDHWDELFATANKTQQNHRDEINTSTVKTSTVIKLGLPENKEL